MMVEVADLAHGGGDEDFAGDGEEQCDEGDAGPGDERGRWMASEAWHSDGTPGEVCGGGLDLSSVRAGRLATKPTAEVRSRMPSQRERERCSCSIKRLRSAMRTLPKAVAGMTKVRSAQERAVM